MSIRRAKAGPVVELLTTLVQHGLPFQVCETSGVGGGRGLFATRKLAKGEPVGPIRPLASAITDSKALLARPMIEFAASRGKRRHGRAPPRVVPPYACMSCFAHRAPLPDCATCREPEHRAEVERLDRLLATHVQVLANEQVQPTAFTLLGEQVMLRIADEWLSGNLVNTMVLMCNLVAPELGDVTRNEEFGMVWLGSQTRINMALRRAGYGNAGTHTIGEAFALLAANQADDAVAAELEQRIATRSFTREDGERHARELFIRAASAIHLNALGGPETCAIYPAVSLINHACVPSAGVFFQGAAVYIVPDRDLDEGEEITIHYAETLNFSTNKQLQRYLSHNYGFECPVDCDCGVQRGAVET